MKVTTLFLVNLLIVVSLCPGHALPFDLFDIIGGIKKDIVKTGNKVVNIFGKEKSPQVEGETTTTPESVDHDIDSDVTPVTESAEYLDPYEGLPKPCSTQSPTDTGDNSGCKTVITVPNLKCPDGYMLHKGKCKKVYIVNG